jgi:hypothetical protein
MPDAIDIVVFFLIIIGVIAILYRGIRNLIQILTGKKNGCCG